MLRKTTAFVLAMLLAACGQGLNWREVRFEGQPDRVLLPCKPEQAERKVPLGAQAALLQMKGCEAQDMQFTWSQLELPNHAQPQRVLDAWQQASLASFGADTEQAKQVQVLTLKGADAEPAATQLVARATSGQQAQFIWWVRAGRAYQLAIYSNRDAIPKGVIQNLMEGIELP
jgi:hypothetical protein